jgi:hypothetical protein
MQKLVLVERSPADYDPGHSVEETVVLSDYLEQGWRVVSVSPVGLSVAQGGLTRRGIAAIAFTVLLEKPEEEGKGSERL